MRPTVLQLDETQFVSLDAHLFDLRMAFEHFFFSSWTWTTEDRDRPASTAFNFTESTSRKLPSRSLVQYATVTNKRSPQATMSGEPGATVIAECSDWQQSGLQLTASMGGLA
jgi:hypothetical protein